MKGIGKEYGREGRRHSHRRSERTGVKELSQCGES
jgi:hypothetical protein